jgi:phospholipid/cholesterol/gamma-HCH transport system ATP-binding protein
MIKVENLKKSFGAQEVLKGINLTAPKGKITFIIGRSGSGKSVLLKHILGLIKPDEGAVYINNKNIVTANKKELTEIRKHFGVMFQNVALFDSMTVFENIAFPLIEHTKLSKEKIRKKVKEKLSLVGLEGVEDKMPSELSGGMQKRVGLARAVILDPEILLFDEPTTGLDPVICDSVDELILETQRKLNLTCLVISHDIPATFKLAHFVAMLDKGKIAEFGTPEQLKNSKQEMVREFLKRDLYFNQ